MVIVPTDGLFGYAISQANSNEFLVSEIGEGTTLPGPFLFGTVGDFEMISDDVHVIRDDVGLFGVHSVDCIYRKNRMGSGSH